MIKGPDFSHWEPGVNFAKLSTQAPFCYLKATEGLSGVDSLFVRYWRQARAAGMLRGAYHFFHPNVDPEAQANHFLSELYAADYVAGDLPPVLDWEVTAGMSSPAQQEAALVFLRTVQQSTHIAPVIYGSPSFLSALSLTHEFAQYPLWIAHYGVETPTVPRPWANYFMWQYSDHGSFLGVPGTSDANLFQGSVTDLRTLTKRG